MKRILLTNDDGYRSIGFMPLLKELSKNFNVTAVAPSDEQSWIGKSISARRKLMLKQETLEGSIIHTVNGSPADCVQIGAYDVMEQKPDLVVSGINIGENIGRGRILSSGTVGAAMEASLDGMRALSSSLYIEKTIRKGIDFFDPKNYHIYQNAAEITAKFASIFIEADLHQDVDLISINIPFEATIDTDFELATPFRATYGKLFHKEGDTFTHVGPKLDFNNMEEGTDLKALSEGKIVVTPMSLELAAKDSFAQIRDLLQDKW